MLAAKCRWAHLPQKLGYRSHITTRHNFKRWQQDGTMDAVLAALGQHGHVLKPATPQKAIGVDVARGGKDKTVVTPQYDNYFAEQVCESGKATPDGKAVATLTPNVRRADSTVRNRQVAGASG
ncbi:hypothetical protein VOI32_40890 [Paraburkholderia caribensis]|uniref:Transposase n=1 Tax=Paraburkholderia caribensis TaxID=75105 RepID=A0ABV0EA90_9BURK